VEGLIARQGHECGLMNAEQWSWGRWWRIHEGAFQEGFQLTTLSALHRHRGGHFCLYQVT
jgi:hypothetical protein